METTELSTQKILLTGAGGFLGKYIIHELAARTQDPGTDIITIGNNQGATINADLTSVCPHIEAAISTVIHAAGACFSGNFRKMNVDITANLLKSLEHSIPENIVYISSTEVYGRTEGTDIDETATAEPSSEAGATKLEAEKMLTRWCDINKVKLSILRCPPIIGTGMNGPLRELVNSIYRGSYSHISNDDSRISVVHAVDVARAAVDIAPIGGVYNMTDGVNPTRHDLAEALSARIGHKRIYTVSPKRARLIARVCDYIPFCKFGTKRLKELTTTLTFDGNKIIETLGRKPNSVTKYLKTHNYDETSL